MEESDVFSKLSQEDKSLIKSLFGKKEGKQKLGQMLFL